jgi:hypothetical protein
MVFDVKYELRNKDRLVARGNLTVDEKEEICSGIAQMDNVRIGFSLAESKVYDIGNAFLWKG